MPIPVAPSDTTASLQDIISDEVQTASNVSQELPPSTIPLDATAGTSDPTVSPPDTISASISDGDIASNSGDSAVLASKSPSDIPRPSQAISEAADPKSTAEADEPPATSPGTRTETQGQQATITGSDGELATWSAVRDPEYSDNTQTQTQTGDDGAIIIIFPGGWKWSPVGGNKGGPLPTMSPTPVDNGKDDPEDDNNDDGDGDDDEDDKEECTTTPPPSCTLTMSYYTREDGEGTSTQVGTCPPVTGCVSGEQSTTTTTIARDVPRITVQPERDDYGREDIPAGSMDEETAEYLAEMFKEWGISSGNTEDEPKASCDGIPLGGMSECLELFSGAFCYIVEGDENEAVSMNLTYQSVVGDGFKAIATGAERRSLRRRAIKCSSHMFNLQWTGADGSCDLSCLEAFAQLQTECDNILFPGLAAEGTIDASCGNYSYQVSREPNPTLSSISLPSDASTTTPTAEATTKEPEASETIVISTDTSTTTVDPKPTTTEAEFKVGNLQCNDEDDFPGHADLHGDSVMVVIERACTYSLMQKWYMTPYDSKPYITEYEDHDTHRHRIIWSWIAGCSMENKNVHLVDPFSEGELDDFGTSRCQVILGDAWIECE
ncbi:hypothetical protein IL306_003245 [Fusarium sp. DS 682]|nr:hypothetical protein IL306_003245 [Fusarium sp. DS 682]